MDTKYKAISAIAIAESLNPSNSSAVLCIKDAKSCLYNCRYEYAIKRALDSVCHQAGIFSYAYNAIKTL